MSLPEMDAVGMDVMVERAEVDLRDDVKAFLPFAEFVAADKTDLMALGFHRPRHIHRGNGRAVVLFS